MVELRPLKGINVIERYFNLSILLYYIWLIITYKDWTIFFSWITNFKHFVMWFSGTCYVIFSDINFCSNSHRKLDTLILVFQSSSFFLGLELSLLSKFLSFISTFTFPLILLTKRGSNVWLFSSNFTPLTPPFMTK